MVAVWPSRFIILSQNKEGGRMKFVNIYDDLCVKEQQELFVEWLLTIEN